MSRLVVWLRIALVLVALPLLGLGALAAAQTATPPAAAACPEGTPGATATAATGTPTAAECVAVDLEDIYFAPNLITIPADRPVTFVLRNEGRPLHNFSITDRKNPDVENLGISVDVPAGETKTVTVDAPAGSYYFFCNQPGHEQAGMFGSIEAKAGAVIETEAATVTPRAG